MMKTQARKNRCKRPFMLLEVLIALMIVTLCMGPLITPQSKIVKEQVRALVARQVESFAMGAYVDVLQQLYESGQAAHAPTWEQVTDEQGLSGPVDFPYTVHLPHNRVASYRCMWSLQCVEHKKRRDGNASALVEVTLTFAPVDAPSLPTFEFAYRNFAKQEGSL